MIQQYIKGKQLYQIKKQLNLLTNNNKIKNCIKYELFDLLPRDENGICYYNGDLIINEINISKLPEKLTINGTLDCSYNKIMKLPNNLIIYYSLHCDGNLLTVLPDDLIVNGNLFCTDNKLTSLPMFLDSKYKINNNIYKKNNIDNDKTGMIYALNCGYNELTYLPDNMVIKGDLNCTNNNLTKLPENLTVYGDLICDEQQNEIKLELPKSAKISGSFIN